MSKGSDRMLKSLKKFADIQYKLFTARYGQQLIDFFDFPIKLVLSPFTLAFDIAGSAPRGFGVPELFSKLSYASIFAVATLGTYDIALDLGKKGYLSETLSDVQWMASIALHSVQRIRKGAVPSEKLHAEEWGRRQRLNVLQTPLLIIGLSWFTFHLPSIFMPHCHLKIAQPVMGRGVMGCPECKDKLQVRISADDIMEPPWKAYNVLRKMDYPYEHIVHSMKDPSIAAFWLFTLPEVAGGFEYDDDIKKKIWWQYKESMRYDQLRDEVAKRKPGWEHLQEGLISIDPVRARDDPVIVKNIPFYKAKKALEADAMKLDHPPRPKDWGELDLPLNASSWSKEDLKGPDKFYEMTVLLNAQREIAEKILDAQWENKWRQEKLNEMLEEKLRPYIQNADNAVLSRPILLQSQDQSKKRTRQRKWWIF